MVLADDLLDVAEQRVELGAVLLAAALVDEPGVAGGLAEAEQRLEHLHLRAVQAPRIDAVEQGLAVVIAQLVVALALLGGQVAVEGLLQLLRQLAGDLLLRAAEDEGAEGAAEETAGGLVGVGVAAGLEGPARAEHPGVEELEQAPQLAEVVLDRRAGEGEAVVAMQQAGGLGGGG